MQTKDPETGAAARRETNTMPQWAGSCWYYLRFISPTRSDVAWDPDEEKYWMPVDLYVGGAEHAVLHLLYARFWHKVLYDMGLVHTVEPFQKLVNQGMILGVSHRFYDDNVTDDPDAAVRRYSFRAVRAEGDGVVAAEDARPLKARKWLRGRTPHSLSGGIPTRGFALRYSREPPPRCAASGMPWRVS